MPRWLDGLDDVVQKLINEEPDGEPMCYSLVDGMNLLNRKALTVKHDRQWLLTSSEGALPSETKSQVIVVWTWWLWQSMGLHLNTQVGTMNRKKLAKNFDEIRRPGTPVYFALVKFLEPDKVLGKTCLPNCEKKDQFKCYLPGMEASEADHLACELDDAILTALHRALTANNRCVIAISDDRRVLKTAKERDEILEPMMDTALSSGFKVTTTFQKVEIEESVQSGSA